MRRFLFGIVLGLIGALTIPAAMAQSAATRFPERAIKIVVPFPAGGPSDVLARLIGNRLSEDFKQPVLIENRPGGNTVIGATLVANAPADGYTLLLVIDSTLSMNQFLYRSLSYDPLNDFVPIGLAAKSMVFVMVHSASTYRTLKDLVDHAQREPGKLNYGTGTITNQLQAFLFNKLAGVKTVMVPFNGTSQTEQGLLTRSVDFIYTSSSGIAQVESGTFRALAKLDNRPLARLPNVPAISAELPEFGEVPIWLGLVAPKGTPQDIVDKLHRHVNTALSDPAIKERADATGLFLATSSSPAEFGAYIRQEANRWSGVIKEAGIKFD
jgi:tripartite-type tricarboxylate transporter receptor subunit TctC